MKCFRWSVPVSFFANPFTFPKNFPWLSLVNIVGSFLSNLQPFSASFSLSVASAAGCHQRASKFDDKCKWAETEKI